MLNSIKILWALLFLSVGVSCTQPQQTKNTLIINVRIFTGYQVLENQTIEIRDSLFYFYGENETPDTNNFTIINGANLTLIPPMVNAHAHIHSSSSLKLSQKYGIFGVLDMFNVDKHVKELKTYRDSAQYSKIWSSGFGATVAKGHGTQFGIPVEVIDEKTSPQKFITDRVENNVDYIKIIKEPFFENTLTDFQTAELIQYTHQYNLKAVAHISALRDARVLAQQKVNGFVHIWVDSASTPADIALFAQNKLFVVPTLAVIKPLIAYLKNSKKHSIMSFDEVLNQVKLMHAAGIPILAGTDAPNFGLNHGNDYFKELYLLADAKLPNIEILKAATTNCYTAFDLGFTEIKNLGEANFVLVKGNPLTRLKDIENTHSVWKNGKVIY